MSPLLTTLAIGAAMNRGRKASGPVEVLLKMSHFPAELFEPQSRRARLGFLSLPFAFFPYSPSARALIINRISQRWLLNQITIGNRTARSLLGILWRTEAPGGRPNTHDTEGPAPWQSRPGLEVGRHRVGCCRPKQVPSRATTPVQLPRLVSANRRKPDGKLKAMNASGWM